MNEGLTFWGVLRLILIFIFWMAVAYMLLFALFLLFARMPFYFEEPEKPMSIEDVDYLCDKLEVESESICKTTENIYPQDFSNWIAGKFEQNKTSYKEVQSIFSRFQVKLGTDTGGLSSLGYYDINQDGVSDIIFYFNGSTDNSSLEFIVFKEDLNW